MDLIWAVLLLLLANLVTIGVMLLIRRRAPEGGYFADSDRASGVFGVLAGGFAIFAGFVVFLAFTSYDQSRSGSETEALTVLQQYETAQFLPVSVRSRLGGELVCYGRSVVHQEWPQMEGGQSSSSINPWSLALFRSLRPVEPSSNAEQSAFDKWLDQTSDREEARRDRIHGAVGIDVMEQRFGTGAASGASTLSPWSGRWACSTRLGRPWASPRRCRAMRTAL